MLTELPVGACGASAILDIFAERAADRLMAPVGGAQLGSPRGLPLGSLRTTLADADVTTVEVTPHVESAHPQGRT